MVTALLTRCSLLPAADPALGLADPLEAADAGVDDGLEEQLVPPDQGQEHGAQAQDEDGHGQGEAQGHVSGPGQHRVAQVLQHRPEVVLSLLQGHLPVGGQEEDVLGQEAGDVECVVWLGGGGGGQVHLGGGDSVRDRWSVVRHWELLVTTTHKSPVSISVISWSDR